MPSASRLLLVAAVAAGAAGFAAGFALRRPPAVEEGFRRLEARLDRLEAQRCPAPPPGAVAVGFDSPALRRDLRLLLQEELRAHGGPGQAPPPPRAEPPLPTAESVVAVERAHRLVEAAAVSRKWTERDAEQLRALLGQLSDAQRDEVLTTLLPALNRGEILVETVGPPF